MPEYKVASYHVTHGHIYVTADSVEDALAKAYTELSNDGESAITDTFEREFDTVEASLD